MSSTPFLRGNSPPEMRVKIARLDNTDLYAGIGLISRFSFHPTLGFIVLAIAPLNRYAHRSPLLGARDKVDWLVLNFLMPSAMFNKLKSATL
jgi:hypothetical protein